MKLRTVVLALAFVFLTLRIPAQATQITSGQVGSGGAGTSSSQRTDTVGGESRTGIVGGVVNATFSAGLGADKGRPFSADVIEETDKFLADGNRIHRETHGKTARDSEGRTRNETEMNGSTTLVHIQIFDPVQPAQRVSILLDPRGKVMHVHRIRASVTPAMQSKPSQPANLAAPVEGQTVVHSSNVRTLSNTPGDRQKSYSYEDLGTMTIEGYIVKGARITTTVPAGAEGNDQAMTSIYEHWFSEELKMELLAKTQSPEFGTITKRLVNINTQEPDPALFQVQAPAGFTVNESEQR